MNGTTSSFFGSDWLGAFLIIAVLFGGFGGQSLANDLPACNQAEISVSISAHLQS